MGGIDKELTKQSENYFRIGSFILICAVIGLTFWMSYQSLFLKGRSFHLIASQKGTSPEILWILIFSYVLVMLTSAYFALTKWTVFGFTLMLLLGPFDTLTSSNSTTKVEVFNTAFLGIGIASLILIFIIRAGIQRLPDKPVDSIT